MALSDWNLDANEEQGQQEAGQQECSICGLPARAHKWKKGKTGPAGYCLFAPQEEIIMSFPFFDEESAQRMHEAFEERSEQRAAKKDWVREHQ